MKVVFLFVAVALAVYLACLPSTVQWGDSGELAYSAWNLSVAHPPGYPLFTLAGHLFAHLMPIGAVFWRLSLFDALLAAATLCVLIWPDRDRKQSRWPALAAAAALAVSRPFWEAAILPEVFALHALITALIGVAVVLIARGPRRATIVTALFFAGLANHLTTLFLMPVVVASFEGVAARRRFWPVLLVAPIAVALLYAALMAFDVDSIYSWGRVASPAALARHILRLDYGALRLSGQEGARGSCIWYFAKSLCVELWLPLGLAFLALAQTGRRLDSAHKALWISLAFYLLIFVPLMNLSPDGVNELRVERFLVMPAILLVLLARSARLPKSLPSFVLPVLAALAVALGVRANRWFCDRSGDTVIEDYALNLLRVIEADARGKPALLVVGSDDAFHAVRYAQSVLGAGRQTLVFSTGDLFDATMLEKARRAQPALQTGSSHDVFDSFVAPNLAKFAVFGTLRTRPAGLETTFLPLARRYASGTGSRVTDFGAGVLRARSLPRGIGRTRYDTATDLYSEYAFVDLAEGMQRHARGDEKAAAAAFRRAAARVPYCVPALASLCKLEGQDSSNCGASLERASAGYRYFQ